MNDWGAYKRHFHEIMTSRPFQEDLVYDLAALRANGGDLAKHFDEILSYVKKLKRRHGTDGKSVVIEDLALRLARLRAGIEETAVYGEG